MSKSATINVTITNKLGLHARPAMMFVECASKYDCDVSVRRANGPANGEVIDGKSIMQMMMLAATAGTELVITAEGDDCDDAVKGLAALVESKFEED